MRPKKKGRKKTLDIRECKKPSKYDGEKPVDTSAEHVKELEDELLKLRIENAYLKELRRLRLEEETLLKNSENCPQSPRTVQIKRHSRSSRFSKGNIYVLAKTI